MSFRVGFGAQFIVWSVRSRGVALLALALGLAGTPLAAAQQLSAELLTAIAAAKEAEEAYTAELATTREPSRSLRLVREEAEDLAAAIVENYLLLECYRSGLSVEAVGDCVREGKVPPPAASLDAERTALVGQISTGIGRMNGELSVLQARARRWEDEELRQPLERARRLYLEALAALELSVGAELARAPITVASVAIDGAGTPFVGTWQWAGDEVRADAAVVTEIQQTLTDVRATIARLQSRLFELDEQAEWSYWAWESVRDRLLARAESEAATDEVVQWIFDGIEVAIAVSTAGTWTALKVAYFTVDIGLRVYGWTTLDDDLADRKATIEGSQLSEELKAAIATRLRVGLRPDAEVNFAGAESLVGEVLGAPSLPVGGIGFEAAKSSVAAWVEWVENGGALPGVGRAYAWLTSSAPHPHLAMESIQGIEAAASELPGFGLSMGLMAASKSVIPFVREISYGVFGGDQSTTEELMRRLALAELRLFILGEQVATLRSLLATLQQGEPAIVEALAEARIRLAGRGQESRAFIDASGALVDRTAPVNLTQVDRPVTVTVRVSEARLRWRLEVVEVVGDRETRLGEAVTDGDTASLSFVPPSLAGGPVGLIEVRVLGMERQNLDGDPATVPAIDTEAAAWVGLEPTPDVYRFVFALPAERPVCTPPPGYLRGPVASTFDSGDEGWTTSGDADRVPISSGGAISAADHETGGTWYWNAPPSFLGDRQRLFGGTLVYALRTDGSGRPFPAADVVLEGNGLALTLVGEAPGANWTTYEIALDPASPWMNGGNPATAAEIRQALACVTALRIRGEYTNGPDRGWFDDVAFGVGPTSTPNLLVNGSFEEGPFPGSFLTLGSGSAAIEGWTVVADTVDYIGTSIPAADGGRHIDLDGTPGAGAIEQSFSTIAGELYEVTFDLASNTGWPPPIKRLQVEAAGDSGFFSHLDGQSWSPITWRFRALGPETTIRFRSLTDIPDPYGGALIDNVSVHFAPE